MSKQTLKYPLIIMTALRENKVVFFVILFFLMFLGLLLADIFTTGDFKNSFWGGVLVEAHGMFLDILLFGILLTVYEKYTHKHNEIKRFKEELEDYQYWQSEEASYRIIGCIRRLQKLKCNDIDLSGYRFQNIVIKNQDFINCNFSLCSFQNCTFRNCTFNNCTLKNASVRDSDLGLSKFIKCSLEHLYVSHTDLSSCLFSYSSVSLSLESSIVFHYQQVIINNETIELAQREKYPSAEVMIEQSIGFVMKLPKETSFEYCSIESPLKIKYSQKEEISDLFKDKIRASLKLSLISEKDLDLEIGEDKKTITLSIPSYYEKVFGKAC